MTKLLQPIKFDTYFDYQVEKDGDIYVAGTRNCECSGGGGDSIPGVWGDLFLDKLGERDSRVWTPRLTNPFATKTRTKKTRQSELYLSYFLIDYSGKTLDEFVNNIQKEIVQECKVRMSKDDIAQFFGQVHKRYMDHFESLC
tara:strand:+ start:13100 stop:13525 length:426 start_codon:yes stop_codon:yes gene_type:complete